MESNIILKAAEIASKGGQPVDWAAIIEMTRKPRPDIQSLAQALIDNEKMASAQVLSQIGMQASQGSQQQPLQQPQQMQAPGTSVPQ
jgi:hypothetical protein